MIKSVYKYLVPEKSRIKVRIYLNKLVCWRYLGKRYFCNCCGSSFRKFLPKGNITRENAQCPCCGSLERTRILTMYLRNETDVFSSPGKKILHIAPEFSLFRLLNKLDVEYVDGDINPAYARNVIDVTAIQYSDNYFDFIICSHVLGHVPNEAKAIKELSRVLHPNGEALIMTLIDLDAEETFESPTIISGYDRLVAYGEPDLCRLHGLDFKERLQKNGFNVELIDYRNHFSEEENERFRLGDGKRELIFRCKKSQTTSRWNVYVRD